MYLFQSVQTMIYMVHYHDIAQKEKTNKSMPMKSVRTCKRVLFCLAPPIFIPLNSKGKTNSKENPINAIG